MDDFNMFYIYYSKKCQDVCCHLVASTGTDEVFRTEEHTIA